MWSCGRQVAAVGAQSCTGLWDIDVYPGSSGSITIGNGCSSSDCRGNNNNDCDAWHVQCTSGRRARLTFSSFQTESGYDFLCASSSTLPLGGSQPVRGAWSLSDDDARCGCGGRRYVFDGDDFSSTSEAEVRASGSTDPATHTAAGTDLLAVFDTDGSALGSGWTASASCTTAAASSSVSYQIGSRSGGSHYNNPCRSSQSDVCCDCSCTVCGPAGSCTTAGFSSDCGTCNPGFISSYICGTYYEVATSTPTPTPTTSRRRSSTPTPTPTPTPLDASASSNADLQASALVVTDCAIKLWCAHWCCPAAPLTRSVITLTLTEPAR